jgi:hypothetical protein
VNGGTNTSHAFFSRRREWAYLELRPLMKWMTQVVPMANAISIRTISQKDNAANTNRSG